MNENGWITDRMPEDSDGIVMTPWSNPVIEVTMKDGKLGVITPTRARNHSDWIAWRNIRPAYTPPVEKNPGACPEELIQAAEAILAMESRNGQFGLKSRETVTYYNADALKLALAKLKKGVEIARSK